MPAPWALCVPAFLAWAVALPSTSDDHQLRGSEHAQRVIGDYYIKKREDYTRRGIKRVDLHAS